ncbi:MAG: hypothetical protein JWR35_1386 [Marmoricola sp.]|nr:hypothetical protein [Marmoricola sp.]
MSSRRRQLIVSVLACSVFALASCSSATKTPVATKTVTPTGPVLLTFAVYGPPQVITAYTKIAADYHAAHPGTVVNVRPFDTHAEAVAALQKSVADGNPPDLFLADRSDLPTLQKDNVIQRVDDLLVDRKVDFGDGYQRDGLEAFSSDSSLLCMPTDVSPMVVFYNTNLVDLTTLAGPGAPPVTAQKGWTMDLFTKAAQLASKGQNRGVYVAPDLEQVAPFIWSGGGDIVDSVTKPSSLTLAGGSSESSLEKLLELVRNPAYTFSQQQIAKTSALQRFKAGHLAMILGYHNLIPQLRAQQNLNFDVMPLPRIGSPATSSEMAGLCISKASQQTEKTANFLAYVVSDAAQQILAETGYVMPSNLDVVNSDDFLQPGQMPINSSIFSAQIRTSRPLPDVDAWPKVNAAASNWLTQLFYLPVIDPLDDRLKAYDTASALLFNPATATPSPTETPSP